MGLSVVSPPPVCAGASFNDLARVENVGDPPPWIVRLGVERRIRRPPGGSRMQEVSDRHVLPTVDAWPIGRRRVERRSLSSSQSMAKAVTKRKNEVSSWTESRTSRSLAVIRLSKNWNDSAWAAWNGYEHAERFPSMRDQTASISRRNLTTSSEVGAGHACSRKCGPLIWAIRARGRTAN